jgi:AsmA protein
MNKSLKYTLVAAGGLVVLFALALVVIGLTVDPNDFKPVIVKLVQEKKQRTLTIQGNIKLKLFPKLGVDLGKTTLSEHKGTNQFAAVDSIRLYVAWLPLLEKELVVDKVTVEGVRANLVRFANGTTNFDDLLSKEESSGQVKFDIDSVSVTKGALTFDDRQAHRKLALSDLNLSSGRLKDGVPTGIKVAFDLAADNPKVAAKVDLKSDVLFELGLKHYALHGLNLSVRGDALGISQLDLTAQGDLDARLTTGDISTKDLKVVLKGLRGTDKLDVTLDAPSLALAKDKAEAQKVRLDAKVARPDGAIQAQLALADLTGTSKAFKTTGLAIDIDGKQGDNAIKGKLTTPLAGDLEALQFNLDRIAAQLSVSNPKLPKGGISLSLNGNAQADLSKQRVVAALTTKLDESTIQAKLGMSQFAHPAYTFDVAIDRLDVDRYLPPKAKGSQKAGGKGEQGPEKPFDLAALKDLTATGSLRIGSLKVSNIKSTNVRLDVKAAGGRVDVNPLSADLYQGSAKGAVSVAATTPPQFSVRQNLTGVSIGPLIKDLMDKDLMEGKGNVSVDVVAGGGTVSALKKGLNGTAAVNLTNGAIKGIDIASAIRTAQSKLGGGTQTQAASAGEKTDFTELKASFRIKNGIAHNDDLSAKSPLLRLGGSGDINIGADSMDYVARATIVGTLEGQGGKELSQLKGVTVPVRIAGPFDQLKYSLDVGALAKESVKAKIEEKKEEVKTKAKEQLQERLKGLFGH